MLCLALVGIYYCICNALPVVGSSGWCDSWPLLQGLPVPPGNGSRPAFVFPIMLITHKQTPSREKEALGQGRGKNEVHLG